MDLDEAARAFREFVSVIKALRTPGTGCPWDLEQTHATLRPYLLEEAYEVLDAIDRGDDGALGDELGDLLLQVVLHAQLADDRGDFSIADVVAGITQKMIRRHPHVFGDAQVAGSADVVRNWERIKAGERQAGPAPPLAASLARVPEPLPALHRAQRLGEKAARVHLDQGALTEVLARLREQLAGLEAEVGDGPAADSRDRLDRRLGEVLFGLCQLARRLGLSAEDSLRACTARFVDRLRRLEEQAPGPLHELTAEELKALWRRAEGTP
jgi:MazG family protein